MSLILLLAFDYNLCFLNINDVDRVDCLGFVWNPLHVLRGDHRDSLDYALHRLFLFYLVHRNGSCWFGNSSRIGLCLHFRSLTRALLCLLSCLGSLLDWCWRISCDSFHWLCGLGVLLSGRRVYSGHWSWRRSLFAPTQELFDVFVVLLAEHSSAFLPFQKQIISCRDVVKPVSLDLLLSLCLFNIVIFDEHAHNLLVNRNGLFSKIDGGCVRWLVLVDCKPWMVSNILDCESL